MKVFHKFKRYIEDGKDQYSYVDLHSITGFEQYAKGIILIHTAGTHYHVYLTIDDLIELLNELDQ